MIGIVGPGSRIAEEFLGMIDEPWRGLRLGPVPTECSRFLVCTGMMTGARIGSLSPDRLADTFLLNFADIATWCDSIFATTPDARICVIGSESGFSGSYDMAYAGAKAALHLYVETKHLGPDQQLVAIAPGIISDAGMTTRRLDQDRLAERERNHPKRRFVTAREVASMANHLLGPDGSYISGTTVRMNGGERR